MRILVTGAASLVGSHLVDRLLGEGHEVVGLDDFSRGSWSTLSHLAHEARFLFVEHDVGDAFRAEVEQVFHLAVPSSSARWRVDPIGAAMTCVAGMRNVLALGQPVVVMTALDLAVDAFGCVERMVEGKDARFVRVAHPYGPRMAPDDPVGRLVVAGMRGDAERGEDEARVTWVDDAVDTLLAARDAECGAIVIAPSREADGALIARIAAEADPDPCSLRVPMHLREGIRRTAAWFQSRVGTTGAFTGRSSGIYLKKPARRTA